LSYSSDQAALTHLDHQRDQPDDADGHVQAVGADEREEGGEEGAALRAGAFLDQVPELVELQSNEHRAENAGNCEPEERALLVVLHHLQHGEAIGDGG